MCPALKQFGEIENIWYFRKERCFKHFAIVEFQEPHGASVALSKRRITIENYKFIVKPCKKADFEIYCSAEVEQKIKVDDILLQPPDEESSKNILWALNDDCLYEIFKRIHASNYYLIAHVCVRFNRVLNEMLTRNYQNNMFDISDMQLFLLLQADNYLRYFGSSIHQAEINGKKFKSSNYLKIFMILTMISEHCVNLRYFRITNFPMEEWSVDSLIPLFTRIEKLSITKTERGHSVFLPSINCPKLMEFEYNDIEFFRCPRSDGLDIPALKTFLFHNTQLERFLYHGNLYNGSENTIHHLAMNIELLDRFNSLKIFSIIIDNSLEHIKIDEKLLNVSQLMRKLAQKKVPIEYLKLINTIVDDEAIEYISQMKTIKKLAFLDIRLYLLRLPARDAIESYIIHLKSALPNLEFFSFQTSDCIDLIFTDEHIDLTEKHLKKKIPEIRLHMQQFKSNAFTDKYTNLTTIQNSTFRRHLSNKYRGKFLEWRLMIEKVNRTSIFCL